MKKVKYNEIRIGDLTNISTGKLDANASVKNGIYPFFTCSKETSYIDIYAFEGESILIAGNGDLNVKHYIGKFNAYQRTYVIQNKEVNKIHFRFLYYFFEKYIEQLRNQAIGGVIKYIKLGNLTNALIPLPPLPQQKAIAAQLDKAQELVQYNEQLIEKYDELQQSLFLDMFGDPVVNEKGWEMVKFAKACEKILGGGTPSKAKPEYYIGSIPWISPKDMKTSIITKGEDFINENALKNSSVKIIPKNSLLMVIRSGILKHTLPVAINVEELTINQDMKAFVPKTNITNVIFMKYFFHSVSPFVLSKVRAVTADNIKFDDIKDLDYILPPLSLQTEFASHIESIELQKEQAKEALAKSKDIFQGLLQGYFM